MTSIRICGFIVVWVTAAIVTLAGCRPRGAPAADAGAEALSDEATAARPARIHYPAAHGSFVDLVADASHAVVTIRSVAPVKSGPAAMFPGSAEAVSDVALGTGFLIEHRGTFILTNDHIIAAAPQQELRVILNDAAHSEAVASVIGRDSRLDLALLSIDVPRLKALPMGSSSELQVGEWVVALGNPFAEGVTASAGIVSSNERPSTGSVVGGTASLFRTYIQTDARIHRGNSGGPLLNTAGEVVGINIAVDERPGELSFAIPIDRVLEVFDALRDYGKVARAYLGAIVKEVDTEQATRLGLPTSGGPPGGGLVTEVLSASPAVRAGIRQDDVILEWDGKAVDHRTLPSRVSTATVGKKVNVKIFRSGGVITLPVVPDKVPD